MKLAVGVAGIAALLGMVACKKASTTTLAATDAAASTDAGPKVMYSGPLEPHLVARTTAANARFVDLPNGKLVLDTGVFVYELTADGLATRLGDVAAYTTHFPDEDDQLGGYDVKPTFHVVFQQRVRGLQDGGIVIEEPPHRWTWAGKAWAKTTPGTAGADAGAVARKVHDARHPSRGRESDDPGWSVRSVIDLPPGIDDGTLVGSADGTVIVLVQTAESKIPVSVIAPPGSRAGKLAPIGDLAAAPDTRVVCDHVVSWSTPHLACRSDAAERTTMMYRLAGDSWERLRLAEEMMEDVEAIAVGYDGALWIGSQHGKLARVTSAGVVDTYLLPKADAALARASYSTTEELGQATKADGDDAAPDVRSWQRLMLGLKADPQPAERIEQIVAAPDGEVWLMAREARAFGSHRAGQIVVHMGRPPIAPLPDPIVVGSEDDQRNEVRNTRPVKAWVGHCAQLFVALAKQRADGSFAPEPVWSRERALGAVLEKVWGRKTIATPQGALVEGWLGGRRVAGVLVWRPLPNTSEALLEKSANAIAEDASSLTGTPSDITCTAPVLARATRL